MQGKYIIILIVILLLPLEYCMFDLIRRIRFLAKLKANWGKIEAIPYFLSSLSSVASAARCKAFLRRSVKSASVPAFVCPSVFLLQLLDSVAIYLSVSYKPAYMIY